MRRGRGFGGNAGVRRVNRVARRFIRRTIVITSAAIIVSNNRRYYNDGHNTYEIQNFEGQTVIEDPSDPSAYIGVTIQN